MFHGFGQDGRTFAELAVHLDKDYTLYSVDLPFHGDSTFQNDRKALSKQEWKVLMTKLFDQHSLPSVDIVAYSLGCKFALSTFELLPARISSLALIAPDGIRENPWYTLATGTGILRTIFHGLIRRPGMFFGISRLLRRTAIIDPGTQRFAESQMNTPEKRRRVYLSWVAFRNLKIDVEQFISLLHIHPIEVIVFVAKNDPVIPLKIMKTFTARLPSARLEVLDKGHYTVLSAAMKMLRPRSE